MKSYGFPLYIRLLRRGLFPPRESRQKLTVKRALGVLRNFISMSLWQSFCWAGILLDDVFFRGYRKVDVQNPVFVIGPPRSGTTFLHRLLAKDPQFTTMQSWEILFAPSITGRKLLLGLMALINKTARPLKERYSEWEAMHFRSKGVPHKTGLSDPEEDEAILIHRLASAFFLSLKFPYLEPLQPLLEFDNEMPDNDRKKIMDFYKRCVQKHLYFHGNNRTFLSKSPGFSTKIESLRETFPGVRFVFMLRDPMKTVPSAISMISYFSQIGYDFSYESNIDEIAISICKSFYEYPLRKLPSIDHKQYHIVLYREFVEDPDRVIFDVYAKLQIPLSKEYHDILVDESADASNYQSDHKYSLDDTNIDEERIRSEFHSVFEAISRYARGNEPQGIQDSLFKG